jgi:hypothetical protein
MYIDLWCRIGVLVDVIANVFALLTVGSFANVARDDSSSDQIPWVNSYGTIVAYCVDAPGHPGGNFACSEILILDNVRQPTPSILDE